MSSYEDQVKAFLEFCKEEGAKGNKLVMGKDGYIVSVPNKKKK